MVPDRGASEINMEVSVAATHTHEAVPEGGGEEEEEEEEEEEGRREEGRGEEEEDKEGEGEVSLSYKWAMVYWLTHLRTLGYIILLISLVGSVCISMREAGHTVPTQSSSRT